MSIGGTDCVMAEIFSFRQLVRSVGKIREVIGLACSREGIRREPACHQLSRSVQ